MLSRRVGVVSASTVASSSKRAFASTAQPIDVGPLHEAMAAKQSAADATGKKAPAGDSSSLATTAAEGVVPTTNASGSGALSTSNAREPVNVVAARLSTARKSTDPYIPNAQRELPAYVARDSDASTAHYSAMSPEEALAFHAQRSPLGTHRGAASLTPVATAAASSSGIAAGGDSASSSSSYAVASAFGGDSTSVAVNMGLTSELGVEHSLHKPLYERPGIRRDLIMQRREERKISLRQVQLEEAVDEQYAEAMGEGGRDAALVAKPRGADVRLLQDQRFAKDLDGGAQQQQQHGGGGEELVRPNSAFLAPQRATRAELKEQAVLNAMRLEDIDRLNRSSLLANEAADQSSPEEEQRFRDMLRATGKFYLTQDDRIKKDLFGAGLDEGLFRYRSSAGVADNIHGDPTMPLAKIDPLVRKRLEAERKDAILGVGPLAKLEAKRKAAVAEFEYEMSLLPEERKIYREEKAKIMTQTVEMSEETQSSHYALLQGEADPSVSSARQAQISDKDDPALLSAVRANTQYPILREVPKLFQNVIVGQKMEDALISYDPVPNNAPVPKAPMWTSSLSIPQRGRKFTPDNWRNPQLSRGMLEEEKIADLEGFLVEACPQLGKDRVFEDNIDVKPRAMYTKGLYAKRRFRKGEVIATIPVPRTWSVLEGGDAAAGTSSTSTSTSTVPSSWKMSLTVESLTQHSEAVKARNVPSYESLHHMLAKPTTSLGVAAHPLFTEQLYLACLIACEKDLGDASPFARLFNSIDDLVVDDDYIKEIHRDSLEPHQYYEYDDHRRRYEDAIRRIQKKWPDAPHFDTIRWAVRYVFSRQRMMPLRVKGHDEKAMNDVWDSRNDGKDLDWFALGIRRLREYAFRATVPKEMVKSAERVAFDTDKAVMPAVIPLVDMLHHDNRGVGSVVMEHCKGGRVVDRSPSYGSEADGHALDSPSTPPVGGAAAAASSAAPSSGGEGSTGASPSPSSSEPLDNHDDVSIVIRANHDLEVGEELSIVYPKCYSVSYTLYKYGFLAYRRSEQDASLYYQQHGADGISKEKWAKGARFEDEDYPDPVGIDEEELIAKATTSGAETTYAQDVGAKPQ